MSQKVFKQMRKYLKEIGAPKWRYDLDKKNYKKINWKQKSIINSEIRQTIYDNP
jgi:translation initiation factor 2 alpha subunit (eIF-2alpha)